MEICKNKKDYPQEVNEFIAKIELGHKYSLRSTDFWEILKECLGIDEWMIMDMNLIQNGKFDAFIMDQIRDLIQGNTIDTEDVYKELLEIGEFTSSEKRLMDKNNINNILCAILLAISGVNNKI